MTMPNGGPTQVPVVNTPSQICPALGTGQSVFILNLDDTANLFVGYSSSVAAGNSLEIAPGASAVIDASRSVWGFTDSVTPPIIIQVSPGTSQFNLGPGQLADIIDFTGLAAAIALEIAETGVSFLSAPEPLFSVDTIPGTSIPFGTNNSTWNAQIAAGVTGMVSSIIYTADIPNLDSHGFPTSWPATVWKTGVTHQVMDFAPDINWVLGATHSQLVAEVTAMLSGVPGGVIPIVMPYHECNLAGKPWTGPQIAQMDALLIPIVHSVMPTALYGRGFTLFRIWSGGEDITPFISTTQQADFYGGDGYQGAGLPTTDQVFLPFMHQIQGIWPNANFAIIETMTTTNVTNWLEAIGSFALENSLFMVQTFFGSGGLGQPFDPSFVPAINALETELSGAGSSFTVGAGATTHLPPLNPSPVAGYAPVNSLSYDIVVNLIAGAGSTNPFLYLELQWYDQDSLSAPAVGQQKWVLPMGTNGTVGTTISGIGPQLGAYLRIRVVNEDTVPCTLQCTMNSTGRTVQKHDFRWDAVSSTSVPNFVLPPSGTGLTNVLGSWQGVNVPAGGSIQYLLGLYAGDAYVKFGTGASSPVITATLTPQPTAVYGGTLVGEELTGVSNPDIGEFEQIVTLPNAPCLVKFTNSDSVAHQVSGIVVSKY